MKRLGWILLILFLILATLLAFQKDFLPAYFNFFAGRDHGGQTMPLDLEEGCAGEEGEKGDPVGLPATNLKKLAREITAQASSDGEKLEAIYDWVTANMAYDVEKAGDIEAFGSGAEYILRERKGICHDYADLTRQLLKAVGIKATYEKGDVHPAPGRRERHAWNHAFIGEDSYGLDTTWGAGFVDEEKGVFVPRPSRLYLTTPEELARLHGDPAYKESREMEARRREAAAAKPSYLPEYEARLLVLINETRASAGLPPFTGEEGLLTQVRQNSAAVAEHACRDEEYSLNWLEGELERKAPQLRFRKAGINLFTLWDYPVPRVEDLHLLLTAKEETSIYERGFQSLAVGVVRRGDLIVVTLIYLSYE